MHDDAVVNDGDWNNRVLCSDEGCIGIIGPDGRCKECGKPYEGVWTPPVGLQVPDHDPENDERPAAKGHETDPDPDHVPVGGDEEWERRILCSDEACIGVIGPDGRCKECGRSND